MLTTKHIVTSGLGSLEPFALLDRPYQQELIDWTEFLGDAVCFGDSTRWPETTWLSNFTNKFPIVLPSGITCSTTEQVYQAYKFEDMAIQTDVLLTTNPVAAKRLAQGLPHKVRADWPLIKPSVMYHVLMMRAEQYGGWANRLMATGDRMLIEFSTKDDYWGVVGTVGFNMLGQVLMQLRSDLAEETLIGAETNPAVLATLK